MRGLDTRISVQRADSTGRNALNEPVVVWSALADVWAQIVPTSQQEFVGPETASAHKARFAVPFSPILRSVTERDRIVVDGQAWNIKGVAVSPVGRNRMVHIDAVKAG